MEITRDTPAAEIAARVSQALDAADIKATLSGGGAVIDFVTSERREGLLSALAPLGFVLASDRRHFSHPDTIFLEFPAAPLQFGNRIVQHDDVPRLDTPWGPLRVVTPAHSA